MRALKRNYKSRSFKKKSNRKNRKSIKRKYRTKRYSKKKYGGAEDPMDPITIERTVPVIKKLIPDKANTIYKHILEDKGFMLALITGKIGEKPIGDSLDPEPRGLQYIPDSLFDDQEFYQKIKEIVITLVKKNTDNISIAPNIMKKDKDVIFALANENSDVFKQGWEQLKYHADDSLFDDPEFYKKIKEIIITKVSESGYKLYKVPNIMKKDKDIVRAALKSNADNAIKYVNSSLKEDKEFMEEINKLRANQKTH